MVLLLVVREGPVVVVMTTVVVVVLFWASCCALMITSGSYCCCWWWFKGGEVVPPQNFERTWLLKKTSWQHRYVHLNKKTMNKGKTHVTTTIFARRLLTFTKNKVMVSFKQIATKIWRTPYHLLFPLRYYFT